MGKDEKINLFYKKKSAFELMTPEDEQKIFQYSEKYKDFLDNAKVEREAVIYSEAVLRKAGFTEYKFGDKIERGGNYFYNNRNKAIIAFRIGTDDINEGVKICAAHIDSPRFDMKPVPLYEDTGIGYLKTHYYGGVRKYQWAALPLALHGNVVLSDGTSVNVKIGEDEGEPVFCITDLLPHLAKDQGAKTLNAAFNGEGMNIIFSSSPYEDKNGDYDDTDDKVKLNALVLLNRKYGIKEEDLISAELSAVPAGKARDVGIDSWMIGAYGHDDRVCAYPALTALIDSTDDRNTKICVLADKEETGSDGNTGMQSKYLHDIIKEIAASLGGNECAVREKSLCLSADVTAGYDPSYSDVYEKRNSALVSSGVAIAKYTGHGGKSSTSDASSELVGAVRRILSSGNVNWQIAEMGKVDAGGGGTVAKYIANLNIDVVDIGVPVLSMHSPFEIISKADLYSCYRAFCEFYSSEEKL